MNVTGSRIRGRRVLTADVTIPSPGWTVFVEPPLVEAFASLQSSRRRDRPARGARGVQSAPRSSRTEEAAG